MSFDIHLRRFNFKSVCKWTNPDTFSRTLTALATMYIKHSAKKNSEFPDIYISVCL